MLDSPNFISYFTIIIFTSLLMIISIFTVGIVYTIILFILGITILYYIIINLFDVNMSMYMINPSQSEIDISINSNKPLLIDDSVNKPQVFNIPDNMFTYEMAKDVCSAYGAELATYSQLEDAYNNGANWCNYGWSADQMALYPTQKKTYDKLQKNSDTKHNCGRPGINGGYIGNPDLKFGVNCFGKKPIMNPSDRLWMESNSVTQSKNNLESAAKINFWKQNIDKLLVSAFNYTNWSRY